MKVLLMSIVCLGICACAEPLSLQREDWGKSLKFMWEFDGKGVESKGTAGRIHYLKAPFSRECELSATITPVKRAKSSWWVNGLCLFHDDTHYWQFGLVDFPQDMQEGNQPLFELQEQSGTVWPCKDHYELIEEVKGESWRYGVAYKVKLSLKADMLTGTVTRLDGTLCYRKVARLSTADATRVVRPALRSDGYTRFDDLQGRWGAAEEYVYEESLVLKDYPPYQCASFVPDIHDQATGYFHVKKMDDDKWWAIDPLGRGFVVFGIDHCTYQGHHCEALNTYVHRELNDKKFKSREEWAEKTLGHLNDWGFNLLTAGVSQEVKHKSIPHAEFIGIGGWIPSFGDEYNIKEGPGTPCTVFPNVFHPDFAELCEYHVEKRCAPYVNDPWLFGYFLDNELCWWGGGSPKTGLFNCAMGKSATHTAKIALMNYCKEQARGAIDTFNKQWGQKLSSFNDILNLTKLPEETDEQIELKRGYLALCAETYFQAMNNAFRKVDSHHMLLASRFAGISGHDECLWRIAGKYCEVVTWNHYGYVDLDAEAAYESKPISGRPLTEAFSQVYEWTQRPMMLTEWSFPALDSGLPCTGGAGQRFKTQKERAKATGIYARTMLAMPFMLGYDYFMWVDEPKLGISKIFPENTNYGLISEDYVPYEDIVNTFKEIQRNPAEARRRPLPPPKAVPVVEKGWLYEKYVAPLPGFTRSAQHPAFSYVCDGKSMTAVNGRLKLVADGKNADVKIFLDGEEYGLFNVMLWHLNEKGMNTWTNAAVLDSVGVVANAEEMVIDVLVHKDIEAADSKPDSISARTFAMRYRLVLLPNADWFLSEVQEVVNTDRQTRLDIKGIFFRLYPKFPAQEPVSNDVPNLWNDNSCCAWLELGGRQRYMGVAAMRYMDINLHYWITKEDQAFHPDTYRRVEAKLEGSASYKPERVLYVLNYFGKGTFDDIKAQEKRLKDLERP